MSSFSIKFLGVILPILLAGAASANDSWTDYIPSLDQQLREKIQFKLKQAGYYNGPIDGKIGFRSKDAIRRYRIHKGIVEVGPALDENGESYPRTLYLTPKLAKALLGLNYSSGTDDPSEQLRLMMLLREDRPPKPVSPND